MIRLRWSWSQRENVELIPCTFIHNRATHLLCYLGGCESRPHHPHSFQIAQSPYLSNADSFLSKMYHRSSLVKVLSLVLFSSACWSAPFSATVTKRSAVLPNMTGSAVIFGPGTYPRANSLSDPSLPAGSIIGAYTAFTNGDNVLEIVMSTDNGNSWQGIGEVTRGSSNANDIDNPCTYGSEPIFVVSYLESRWSRETCSLGKRPFYP